MTSATTYSMGRQEAHGGCAVLRTQEPLTAAPPVSVPTLRPVRRPRAVLFTVAMIGLLAVFLVISDEMERRLVPELSTAWHHFLLTARSVVVIGAGCGVVYWLMRSHQARIEQTADELGRRLASFRANGLEPAQTDGARDAAYAERPKRAGTNGSAARSHGMRMTPLTLPLHARRAIVDGPFPAAAPNGEWQVRDEFLRPRSDGLARLGRSCDSLLCLLDREAEEVHRMQAQMVEKEKMVALGQLAAGFAHEIRNPLSSISSVVQMLQRHRSAPANGDQLDLIQKHIQRISSTVRQLSRLAQPVVERWEYVELWATLEEAVTLVSFDRRARDVRVVVDRPDSIPRTYALAGQLQQVFINLLLNALDAMPSGGVLTVRARAHAHSIDFIFEDTGEGIPPGIGRRVFEPFFTTKTQGRGSGLGLAVSYGIVQKHGGRIDFCQRSGGGTVFTVAIPVVTSSPEIQDERRNDPAGRR